MTSLLTIGDESGRVCEIRIGRRITQAETVLLEGVGRAAVFTQPSVARMAAEMADSAAALGVETAIKVLPDGEHAKNLRTVEAMFEWLSTLGFTRDDMAVAVGGGAATDVVGFAAATYLRGIEVSYVPTTLLAAVDASIGGKTGVNVGGKNMAGVFRHPARVVVDLEVLERLPDELLREGAAEVIKAGFIGNAEIVGEYETNGLQASLDLVVPAAIRLKVDTVEQRLQPGDERS